jgi:hypothetical protein
VVSSTGQREPSTILLASMKGLSMKHAKTLCATALLSLAALGSTAAQAAGIDILNEGFENVGGLAGWVIVDDSYPPATQWFQGNPGIFTAQSGPADSYVAANFQSISGAGSDIIKWMFTPVLDLSGITELSFYTRGEGTPGFADLLQVWYVAGTDVTGPKTLLGQIGGPDSYPTDWRQFTLGVDVTESGRFGFRYLGDSNALNYIGVDTVSVVTAVPEPTAWTMMALGLGVLPILRRKARA